MNRKLLIAACVLLVSIGGTVNAHRLDEYLQATLFTIEHDRVEALLRLTPGVAVSPFVLASIDTHRDGVISQAERQAYAERVLRDLSLTIDGSLVQLELSSVDVPPIDDINEGLGEIRIRLSASLPHGGANRRLVFENHHQERISVYLVNCLVPSDPHIHIVAQQRNKQQSEYRVEFTQ